MASTYSNLEVIVSDDASSDNTQELVYAIDDPRVHFFQNEERIGPPGNWNRALEKASGEYVGLLNHDDLYGPFWLAFAVHMLGKYPHIGWVMTAYRTIDAQGRDVVASAYFTETREYGCHKVFPQLAGFFGWSPVYLARRTVVEDIGLYDEDFGPCADTEFFLRLASRYPLYYSTNPHHAAWRTHKDNLTHKIEPPAFFARRFRMLCKTFHNNSLPEDLAVYREPSYVNLYDMVLDASLRKLEVDDFVTAQQLIDLLHRYKNLSKA